MTAAWKTSEALHLCARAGCGQPVHGRNRARFCSVGCGAQGRLPRRLVARAICARPGCDNEVPTAGRKYCTPACYVASKVMQHGVCEVCGGPRPRNNRRACSRACEEAWRAARRKVAPAGTTHRMGGGKAGEWLTDANLARAQELWDEGLSAARVAKEIGSDCSKGAIVGMSSRHGWSPHPSTNSQPRQSRAQRPKPVALPALASVVAAKVPSGSRPPVVIPPPPSVPERRAGGCQWIIGNPKQRGWHFCGEARKPGKPYCPDHCGLAYVKRGQSVDVGASV
jgi:GcrA cell cycle regulator